MNCNFFNEDFGLDEGGLSPNSFLLATALSVPLLSVTWGVGQPKPLISLLALDYVLKRRRHTTNMFIPEPYRSRRCVQELIENYFLLPIA